MLIKTHKIIAKTIIQYYSSHITNPKQFIKGSIAPDIELHMLLVPHIKDRTLRKVVNILSFGNGSNNFETSVFLIIIN